MIKFMAKTVRKWQTAQTSKNYEEFPMSEVIFPMMFILISLLAQWSILSVNYMEGFEAKQSS